MSALELHTSSPAATSGSAPRHELAPSPYAAPWFARPQHLFGTTPAEVEYVDEDGPHLETCGVMSPTRDLLRNILLIAQSGWGKTTVMFRALCFLLFSTETPMVIFDGSGNGTLSKNLLLWWHSVLDRAEQTLAAEGKALRADLRSRLLYMKVEERNRCGVSFDLFHPSVVRTTDGHDETMGVKEIVTALMGALAYMEEENEKFKLVRRYGEAGFAILLAGGKKAKDLEQLYDIESAALRLELGAEIERRYDLDLSVKEVDDEDSLHPDWTTEYLEERDYIRKQWHVVNDLFRQVKNSAAQLEAHTGSTLRHFAWLTTTFKWFFNRPIVRLDRFFTRGGALLVHAASGDRDANANARAAIYSACRTAMRSKDRTQPSLFVLDEQEGWRMGLMADDVAANARNNAMYHWFSLHDPEQVGRSFKTIWNMCQRKIIGALADEDVSRFALLFTDLLRPDALRIESISTAETQSQDQRSALRTSNGSVESSGRISGTDRSTRESVVIDEGGEEEVFENRSFFTPAHDQWGAYDVPDERYGTIYRERAPSTRRSREAHVTKSTRDTCEESVTFAEVREKGSSRGSATTTTQGSDRVPIGEQIPFFTRGLVNPPIGRGLHIAMGEEATFVDHAIEPLPLDAPGADARLEELVRAQRGRLEAAWERRRPGRASLQPIQEDPTPVPEPPHEHKPPAQRTTGNREAQHAPRQIRKRSDGPAPTWAGKRGGRR